MWLRASLLRTQRVRVCYRRGIGPAHRHFLSNHQPTDFILDTPSPYLIIMIPSKRSNQSIKIAHTKSRASSSAPLVVSSDDDSLPPPITDVTRNKPSSSLPAKTSSIPIKQELVRSLSEMELCAQEAAAEYKDSLMFARIVHGVQAQARQYQHADARYENESVIANIWHTRNHPPEQASSLESRDQSLLNMLKNPPTAVRVSAPPFTAAEEEGIFVLDL